LTLPKTIHDLSKYYGDAIQLRIVDNSGIAPKADWPVESIDLLFCKDNENELIERQWAALERGLSEGKFPAAIYAELIS